MKWIITRDFHPEQAGDGTPLSWVDTCPNFTPLEREAVRKALPEERLALFDLMGLNHEFQLQDDDGNVLLEGRCQDLDDQDGDSAFEPLDTFEQVYGATTMMFRKVGDTEWEQL